MALLQKKEQRVLVLFKKEKLLYQWRSAIYQNLLIPKNEYDCLDLKLSKSRKPVPAHVPVQIKGELFFF